jgi:hypothetical protein
MNNPTNVEFANFIVKRMMGKASIEKLRTWRYVTCVRKYCNTLYISMLIDIFVNRIHCMFRFVAVDKETPFLRPSYEEYNIFTKILSLL